jgi:hypothetical protein
LRLTKFVKRAYKTREKRYVICLSHQSTPFSWSIKNSGFDGSSVNKKGMLSHFSPPTLSSTAVQKLAKLLSRVAGHQSLAHQGGGGAFLNRMALA